MTPPADGAQTAEERRKDLERELDESLSEIDRALLREKETLAEQRPEGAAGSRDGRTGAETGGGSSAADGDVGGESASAGKPGEAEHDPRVPADLRDGSDDDVVARQLREAAMSEDDPELREKLWEEYRAYKSGQRRAKKQVQEDGNDGDDNDH